MKVDSSSHVNHDKMGESSIGAAFLRDPKRLFLIFICMGVILRVGQYLFNRSLDHDEASIALNIINRSLSGLLQPLDYDQGAPIGFLAVERILVQAFGNNEYVLRLFPLACGVGSLFFFHKVATRFLQTQAIPIALGLFAVCDPLIYYSSAVKQYSGDVCIALLIFYALASVRSKTLTTQRILGLGAVGAISVWFSHPSVFVLAGVGTSLALLFLMGKEWSKVGKLSAVCFVWLLSFAGCYFASLDSLAGNQAMLRYWEDSFMPIPPVTLSDIIWFPKTFLMFFKFMLGISFTKLLSVSLFHGGLISSDLSALSPSSLAVIGFVTILTVIPGFYFLVGCVAMLSEKREELLILSSPILFALLASALHKYPFSLRLILFIAPSVVLITAEGAAYIRQKAGRKSPALGAAAIILLLAYPLSAAGYRLIEPRASEEIKAAISYLKDHRQEGDTLYVYYASERAFDYYSMKYGIERGSYILGVSSRRDWSKYIEDLDRLSGKDRVWLLFSHVCVWEGVDEEDLFLDHLDTIGKRLRGFTAPGASAYLYDLRNENSPM